MKLWAVLLAFVNFSTAAAFAAEAPRMETEELKSLLGNPGVVIIDVRAGTDWLLTGDKIKGAVRENPKDFNDWHGKYSADKTLVLYCA